MAWDLQAEIAIALLAIMLIPAIMFAVSMTNAADEQVVTKSFEDTHIPPPSPRPLPTPSPTSLRSRSAPPTLLDVWGGEEEPLRV
jgi:hypothetical protein